MIHQINSLDQMQDFANKISKQIKKHDIICLSGNLGAGKTTLIKMIALDLGVKNNITSPTFAIAKVYNAKNMQFTHIDAYRLDGINNKEMFDEYIYNDGATFIEWPEFLDIKKNVKKINIKVKNKNERVVETYGFIF